MWSPFLTPINRTKDKYKTQYKYTRKTGLRHVYQDVTMDMMVEEGSDQNEAQRDKGKDHHAEKLLVIKHTCSNSLTE